MTIAQLKAAAAEVREEHRASCSPMDRRLRKLIALVDSLDAARQAEELVKAYSFCAECGPNVRVDEDGCCAGCGATATGSELPRLMGDCLRGVIKPRRPTKKARR